MKEKADVCILISAGAEWRALLPHFSKAERHSTPYGECFSNTINDQSVIFLHGGWGKVAAAGSAQYAIDRWRPQCILNLGTCGGFSGQIERNAVILAERTIIYDILEQMGDNDQAIAHYTIDHDLDWLPENLPQAVTIGTLVSADRDILPEDIPRLIKQFDAVVADWESGAIAWVARQNNLPCLILRGVTDLVNAHQGEAYGNYALFEEQCKGIMADFAEYLTDWLDIFKMRNK